ncbi:putative phthalate transporter [Phaeomoniella chlamydospora]|uniref:Putative phthalate transporter n=1 Tax=Phaeomoniella chlamydospora TaxID=158046 RepID=A0A0G2EKF5_PHACM|nr:putative phthalate transporter [Phaeomoniella chlamydospora]
MVHVDPAAQPLVAGAGTASKGLPMEFSTSQDYDSDDNSESDVELDSKAFLTDDVTDHYAPIESYEGRHRYDPNFRWDEEEERKVVRKIDIRICSWVCLAFFALQLDRANIVQALSDNMLDDLGLNTNDYNTGQTIFYVSFLLAELPSQLISKKLGPERWIPVQMVMWSLIASCQAFLSGRGSFFVTRCLIGIAEGGFIPDYILYLSYWYTGGELPRRLSWFWVAYEFTSIVGAFLAFGLLRLGGVNGMEGWRWLFAIEGTITGLIGIATYFYLPASPTETASWFRGKHGWFNEREEKIMVNRILRDDPSKGDMHNRQAVTPKLLWSSLADWEMWPMYIIGLSFLIPVQPVTAYLTLNLKALGFGIFATNLLTIPAYVLFIINLLFWTSVSERTDQRFLTGLVSQIWVFPLLLALEWMPDNTNAWVKYMFSILIVGSPYVHAINVAITSRNAGSVRLRTVASALYNMFVQASNLISSNVRIDLPGDSQ